MKDWFSKILYICVALVAVYLLIRGHQTRRSNQIILGTGLLVLAVFIAHYPLSFVKDKGF